MNYRQVNISSLHLETLQRHHQTVQLLGRGGRSVVGLVPALLRAAALHGPATTPAV